MLLWSSVAREMQRMPTMICKLVPLLYKERPPFHALLVFWRRHGRYFDGARLSIQVGLNDHVNLLVALNRVNCSGQRILLPLSGAPIGVLLLRAAAATELALAAPVAAAVGTEIATLTVIVTGTANASVFVMTVTRTGTWIVRDVGLLPKGAGAPRRTVVVMTGRGHPLLLTT